MNPDLWYVNAVLREMECERRDSPHSQHRWLMEWQQTAPPRRALAAWLGDRLVGAGERLRRWSTTDAPPMRPSGALQD